MIIVPTRTPGVNILRDVPTMGEPDHRTGEPGGHAEIIYDNVRVPEENLVGSRRRLRAGAEAARAGTHPPRHALAGPVPAGLRHAVRAGAVPLHPRLVPGREADDPGLDRREYAEMQAARLLTLQAAWKMDQLHESGRHASDARIEIATIKFWGAKVLYNVIDRAIQVHGSLGYTTDLPLESMYRAARAARIYDGPDEVHKVTVARQVLKRYKPAEVPTEHVPTRRRPRGRSSPTTSTAWR